MPPNIAKDEYGYLSVYAGEKPWHPEIGTLLADKPSATPREIITASKRNGGKGLGYIVSTVPAGARIGRTWYASESHRAIIREDTKQVFGFASDEFVPIQNVDVLTVPYNVLRHAQDRKIAKTIGWISAGAIGDGAKLFATLDLTGLVGELAVPGDKSLLRPMLTATWAHDASEALRFLPVMRRTECANMRTMDIASGERTGLVARVTHRGDTKAQMTEALRVLGYVETSIKAYIATMTHLADITIPAPRKWIDGFLTNLIPIPPEMERTAGREAAREAIKGLFLNSDTLRGVPFTPYRALQAVDEYADHVRPMRSADKAVVAERKMRALLGEGPVAEIKRDAIRLIREEFEVPTPELVVARK